ncbi:MAG TPA: type II toxin-antitoxin system RelE/ParE family toxin [Candidatus Saccharimonadia bacterium]|nr:type II toxin-antitoxin system RelE/ParE family toxin [Candidatus Saccharimonadia bacterium]
MYETPSGQPLVQNFIDGVQKGTRAKVYRQIDLLELYGPQLGMPHSKPMGGGLYELRVRGQQEVRVFYIFAVENTVYLLHGFQKKSQSTPKKELDLARRRQGEIEAQN